MASIYNVSVWLWRIKRIVISPINAIRFLDENVSADFEGKFRYSGGRFICRKQDWFGIMEIFLNNEYGPALDYINSPGEPSIIDLGANIGGFALFMFENYPKARIVSVEAAPDTFRVLERNQEMNAQRNWDVLQAAVWTENGVVNLDRRQASTGHRIAENGSDGESITARRLDDILKERGIDNIDLMKMDIEGAEGDIVPGSEAVFEKTKVLVIEIHTDRIDPSSVYKTLNKCFSHCWMVTGRNVQKPVFILAHEDTSVSGTVPVNLSDRIDLLEKERGGK
ncbi:MAG: FkbM family methyltransferase [Candidatus Scalindua sp.]